MDRCRSGSFLRGLRSVVALGAGHIVTGTDHLLFLFALVLVAPLTAVRSWRERSAPGASLPHPPPAQLSRMIRSAE